MKHLLVMSFLFAFMISPELFGQESSLTSADLKIPDPDKIQIITMQGGSTLVGRITEIGEDEITFETDAGKMTLAISKIEKVKEVPAQSMKKGQLWFENPNTTRLYFAPTARMLKRGEGYFSDYMLFFPGIAYGFTDNFTFGGGMTLIPGVDIDDQVFYFTPKFGLKTSHNSNIAAGALILALPEIDDKSPAVGILYGVGTYPLRSGDLWRS